VKIYNISESNNTVSILSMEMGGPVKRTKFSTKGFFDTS